MFTALLSVAFAAAPADVAYKIAEPVSLDGSEPLFGPADARFQVVEFVDYGCPHCAAASSALPAVLARHANMNLRVKVFPLSGACNAGIENKSTPAPRCTAAYAAVCAQKMGKYSEMAQWLFSVQSDLGTADMAGKAQDLGLSPVEWSKCIDSPETRNAVLASAAAGAKAGVEGTPSFYISGIVPGKWVSIVGSVEEVEKTIAAAETRRP